MPTIVRRLEIDSGHRLKNHSGKCRWAHGHRYVFDITCFSSGLDPVGRVIDFSVIKSVVGGWLDSQWDHGFILNPGDLSLASLLTSEENKVFLLHEPGTGAPLNPTAENLAMYLFHIANELLKDSGVVVSGVTVFETPNCRAVYPDPER